MGCGGGCSVGGTLMLPLHPLNQQLLRMHVGRLIDLGDLLLDLFLVIMMVAMVATMDPVMVGDSFYPGARHVVGVVVGRLVVDYAMVAVGAHYGLAGESRRDEDGEGCHDNLKDTIVVVNKQYNTIQYNTIQCNTMQRIFEFLRQMIGGACGNDNLRDTNHKAKLVSHVTNM